MSIFNKVGAGSSTFIWLVLGVSLGGITGVADEGARQAAVSGGSVIITAKPRFAWQEDWFIHLIISDTNGAYAVPWSIKGRTPFTRVSLDSNRVYTFTVDKEFSVESPTAGLRRVEADGRTIYDVEMCEVHKVKMELKQCRIAHGRRVSQPGEPPADWEQWTFPHWRESVWGGCLVDPDSPKTLKIYVCNQCTVAYDKWKKDKANGPYAELALKSISQTEPPLALINNKTFASGEKGKVKLVDGSVAVECIEIHGDSVTVRVGDEAEVRELQCQGGRRCISPIDLGERATPSAAERLRRARLALINDKILMEIGDRAEVMLGEKRVAVECVEIRDASATVRLENNGELRELPARVVMRAVR